MHDPFGNLTGYDLEGFHSGGDTEAWRRLGSHVITIDDTERGPISGVRFSVWAPNAQRVLSLVISTGGAATKCS